MSLIGPPVLWFGFDEAITPAAVEAHVAALLKSLGPHAAFPPTFAPALIESLVEVIVAASPLGHRH